MIGLAGSAFSVESMGPRTVRRAKRRADDDEVPFRAVLGAALRRYLDGGDAPVGRYRLRWKTEKGKLRPGVRLDDRAALFDLMGERE
jgi:hypothetical protein